MTETQKIQKLILYIANEVIRICDKNDIPYNITAGTLLGAVRHKGFIPWDDDFDFAMTRNDYERFLKACKKDLNTDIFSCRQQKRTGILLIRWRSYSCSEQRS